MTKTYPKSLTPAVLLGILLFLIPKVSLALNDTAKTSGNWSTITWSTGAVPLASQDAIIPNGIAVAVGTSTVTAICRSLTILSGGTLTQSAYTLNIEGKNAAGTYAFSNSGTFTATGGLVEFTGATQLITSPSTSLTFYNAKIGAGATVTVGGSLTTLTTDSLTVAGTFTAPTTLNINSVMTLSAGGIFIAGTTINAAGNWVNNGGTFTPGTNIVNFVGSTAQSIKGSATTQTFDNIAIASTQTVTAAGSLATLDINGNLTLTSGTFKPGAIIINIDGNWINNGATFTSTSSTVNFINNTANQIIGGVDTSQTFFKISVNDAGYTVTAPSKTLTINGGITLTAGTFAAGATTNISGANWTNNGGTFNPDSNLVEFTSSNDTINGTTAIQTFYNVQVSGTGILMPGGSLTTLNMHNFTFKSATSAFTAPATINMSDNWINNGGTFTPGTNIVNFIGTVNQAIKGTVTSQTFYNIGLNDTTKTLSTDTLTTLNILGNLTLTAGTFKPGAISINIDGNWTNNYATFTSANTTVNFIGTTAQTIGGVKTSQTFYNINVNDPGETVTAPTTLTIDGSLTLTGGDFVAGKTIDMKGPTWTNNGGAFTPGTNTVDFLDTNYSHIINGTVASQTFYNVIVNDSGQTVSTGGSLSTLTTHNLTLTAGTLLAPAILDINGNLTLSAKGTLTAGKTINEAGNWINNGGTFTSLATDSVNFNGTIAQKIRGTTSTNFNNLTINNSNTAGVSLGNNESVIGALTLTDGVVTTYADSTLIVDGTGTSTIGNASSYVNGPMTKIGNTAFVFPLGNNGIWADMGISTPQNSNNNITAQYYATSYPYTTPVNTPLTNVSTMQYWALEETSPDAINVTLYWQSGPANGISNYDSVKVAEYDGSVWNSMGNVLSGSSPGPGTITSTTPVSAANVLFPFTLGTDGGNNPLPITLTSFTATYIEESNSVLVDWSVASQLNNKEFIVEKTLDGINYTQVGTLPGAGTTSLAKSYFITDNKPTQGISYYRLEQIDMDGNPSNFPPAAVFIGNEQTSSSLTLYPSPVSISANLNYLSTDENPLTIDIIDITGRTISSFTFSNVQNGENNFILNTSDLSSGVYFIRASEIQKVITTKFIKL